MASHREKMLAGDMYDPMDKELVAERMRAKRILDSINATAQSKHGQRKNQFESLFAEMANPLYIESPFHCDYGSNIFIGKHFYANVGCVILDAAKVTIGDNCKLGPHVGLYTATHPLDPTERLQGLEFAMPISLGNNVWIGGNATVLPGVTIGDNCVIGAGAVVTKSFPESNLVIAGNPARIIKRVDLEDGENDNKDDSSN